ncbi:MAG: hypothetical protein Q7S57_02725 [bacterium]|nr:hypothetical protein [bacterium]
MTILSLLLIAFIPGLPLATALSRKQTPLVGLLGIAGSLGIAWTIFYSFVISFVHIGLSVPVIGIFSVLPIIICLAVPPYRRHALVVIKTISWPQKRFAFLYVLIILFLTLPIFTVHHQLPTGDVQKAIYWANNILQNNRLPNYQSSLNLNRDPSDFLTPGLHSLTAVVIKTGGDQFVSTAWFSFWAGIILAALGVAITALISTDAKTQLLVFFFASTNIRFLRYVFYPGYHYQNLIGEILLVTGLFLFLFTISKWQITHNYKKLITPLAVSLFCLLLLPIVHQFTAFLATFVALGLIITLLIFFRTSIFVLIKHNPKISAIITVLFLAMAIIVIFFSPLTKKLSALFNLHPHLKPFTISLLDYPSTFGVTVFLFGLVGLLVTYIFAKERKNIFRVLLATFCLVFLFLGQGSKLFIDIPSARTLFYACLPLSIFAGIFLSEIIAIGKNKIGSSVFINHHSSFIILAIAIAIATQTNSASQQLIATNHSTRVNASLTPETLDMLSFLKQTTTDKKENFLIDDWNRRRLTWGILSPFNMITRIGGDFGVIGKESKQSPLRKKLYETGLDYEKIFMLGNNPIIANLLVKQNIKLIGTAVGASTDTFKYNPYLTSAFTNTETTIYSFQAPDANEPKDNESDFLLQPATIANELGDSEDTQAYSAISVTATRISDPLFRDDRSLREIQSNDGSIHLNVGTYVKPLWDPSDTKKINTPLKLLIRLQNNGATAIIKYNGQEITNLETEKNNQYADKSIIIPADTLSYNNKGFIDLNLNIKHGPLVLDLIASGPTN